LSKPLCLPVAAIILAAGAATRMGRLKQLLRYQEQTLIERSVQQAMGAGFGPVIVVVGAEADAVQASVAARRVEIVHNAAWQTGMGSSIAAGMRRLREMETDSAAVAILLVDQPLVTAGHLDRMRQVFSSGNAPVVAAQYNNVLGVPALFKRELFSALAALPAEAGARQLLREPDISVTPFPLPEAGIDIDTPEDFAALQAAH
jgi:molybdenum cofactor cytidylyltransferase